mgnify:CR=1 FL=1|jgi:hypothetical protein
MQSVTLQLVGLRCVPLCLNSNAHRQGNTVIGAESLRRTAFASGIPKRVADSGGDTDISCLRVRGRSRAYSCAASDRFHCWLGLLLDNLNAHCSVTLQDLKDRLLDFITASIRPSPSGSNGTTPVTASRIHDQTHGGKLKTAANTD